MTDRAAESATGAHGQAVFRMKIGGMSCSFCTSTIDKAYSRIDGVSEVGVSLAHEEGLVKYDPSKVTPEQLRRTLTQIGYVYRDPEKVRTFEEDAEELRREKGRLVAAASFTVATLALMAVGMWLDLVSIPLLPWILLALALDTMFVTGWFIKKMAWASLRRWIWNQHVLLEFAAFAGIAGGLLGMFVFDDFPVGDFFGAATLVTTYHILSHYSSLVVRTRASQAVRRLMELRPDTARVIRDGEETEVPLEEVVVGDRVRIRPGESIPVDGQVVEGISAVNQALVTGEPIPAEKMAGDEVIGGSINQTGTLVVEVTKVGEESFLSQVARSIEEARALRPGVLQLVDTVLRFYVPGVLVFAAAGFVGWSVLPALFGNGPLWTRAMLAGLAALVMGYPCALGMATPLATIRGGGEAARKGILMRSGEAFQIMGQIGVIVLDKTGTITRGEPSVHAVIPTEGVEDDEVLRLAAAVEVNSEHPLARAVEDAAESLGLELPSTEAFTSHTGQGVEATLDGTRVLVGKPGWLTSEGVDLSTVDRDRERLEEKGQTVIAVASAGRLVGLVGIADTLKDDAAETIRRIKNTGIIPVMITGDNRRTAQAVADQVGIDRVLAEVLPDRKAAEIRRLQTEEGQRVMMVGDGINDAPALTQADIGVAVGAGTDIAIESADIVILGHRLGAVMDAHQIGVNSYRKTKQNLMLAFSFNGIGVPAATTGLVSPVWAMLAMITSVTAVLANSFGGTLLRGESITGGFGELGGHDHHPAISDPAPERDGQTNAAPTGTRMTGEDDRPSPDHTGGWLNVDVDGRPVRFWLLLSVVIAAVTVGFGAWWVWGADRDAETGGVSTGEMAETAATETSLPPVQGFYAGEEIFFVHSEASDPDVAGMLTSMMGSPVLVVPELAEVPPESRDDVFVFTNGVEGMGPFGFQPDVFPSAPGDEAYRPLRRVVLVTWADETRARELRSAEEVTGAADAGQIDLEETAVVVNMPLAIFYFSYSYEQGATGPVSSCCSHLLQDQPRRSWPASRGCPVSLDPPM